MEQQKIVLPLPANHISRDHIEVKLNHRLRSLRKAKGKTLKDMSEYIGVTISTYAGYEAEETSKNHRTPSIDKIVRLADYFCVSVDYLVGASDEKPQYTPYDVTELAARAELEPHIKATFDYAISEIYKKNLIPAGV